MQYPGNEKFLPVDQNTRGGRTLGAVVLGLVRRKEALAIRMLIRRVEHFFWKGRPPNVSSSQES